MSDSELKEKESNVDPDWFESQFGDRFDPNERKAFEKEEKKLSRNEISPENDGTKRIKFVNKLKKGRLKLKKWQLIGLAGFGGGGILLIMLFLIFLSTLTIPHFMSNVTGWQFAKVTREFRQSNETVLAEKTAIDTADDTLFGTLREKYANLRNATWGKFDQFRPEKVFTNMEAEGRIQYNYSDPKGIFRRRTLESVTIDGNEIPADFKLGKWSRYFSKNREGRIKFAAEIQTNIDDSLTDYRPYVRDGVFNKVLDRLGIPFHFWEDKGAAFKDAAEAEADLLNMRQTYALLDYPFPESSTQELSAAAKAAKAAEDNCVKSDSCAQAQINDPQTIPKLVADEAAQATSGSAFKTVLSGASTLYAIAVPMCIIYDGSVENSAGTVDANSARSIKAYSAFSSAAHQQEVGDTNGKAVAALTRQLGNVSGTAAQQRVSGQAVDQSKVVSPEASAGGIYSLLNVVLPSGVASAINSFAPSACSTLTDVKTAVAAGLGELALGFFSGGASKGAEEGVAAAVKTYLTKFVDDFSIKEFATKFAVQAGAIGGLTMLAKLIVISHMGGNFSGADRNTSLASNIDMGGNLAAGEMNRQDLYGRPLTSQEDSQTTAANIAFMQQQTDQQSIGQRYFAVSNPQSLISRIGLAFSGTTLQQSISSGVSSLGSIFSFKPLMQLMGNMLQPKPTLAAAATSKQYPIVQWGWSEAETNLIDTDDSYTPLENARILEQSGKEENINKEYKDCFTKTVGTLLEDKDVQRDNSGMAVANKGKCSPDNLGLKNSKYGDLVFRWRLKHRYETVLNGLTDIQNAH